jgi:hypothetical protein
VNADASVLLSDFDASSSIIRGQWQVNTANDDDFMGFVFGYQGRGQYYLFDWKQGNQDDGVFGLAEAGMTIKTVNIPGGGDPPRTSLWPTSGGEGVTPLFHNETPWKEFTTYDFELLHTPGSIAIQVKDGPTTLLSETIMDATFSSGRFGFYNYSQDSVEYRGFTNTPLPEPTSLAFLETAAVLLPWTRRRRIRHSGTFIAPIA